MNREDLAEVDCRPDGDEWTLVFIREYAHPPAKVWAALTEPEQLRQWSPFAADRDLGRVGGAMLTMLENGAGDPGESTAAEVTVAEPPTLLVYTWGTDVLRWELAPIDGGTRLTLRHTVKDRDWISKVAAGWHLCLVVAGHLLDGDPIPPIRGEEALGYFTTVQIGAAGGGRSVTDLAPVDGGVALITGTGRDVVETTAAAPAFGVLVREAGQWRVAPTDGAVRVADLARMAVLRGRAPRRAGWGGRPAGVAADRARPGRPVRGGRRVPVSRQARRSRQPGRLHQPAEAGPRLLPAPSEQDNGRAPSGGRRPDRVG